MFVHCLRKHLPSNCLDDFFFKKNFRPTQHFYNEEKIKVTRNELMNTCVNKNPSLSVDFTLLSN